MNTAFRLHMKLLFNNIFLHLASLAIIYGQVASPTRFSLKSVGDGEVSYFDDGFASNVVAEIRLMGLTNMVWYWPRTVNA